MPASELISLVLALLIGSGGSAGLGVYFIRRAIEKKLKKYEVEAEEASALKKQLSDADSRLHHAYGNVIFWIYRAITTGKYSKELTDAYRELESAEREREAVEREIVSVFSRD